MTIEQVLRNVLDKILASVEAPGLQPLTGESNLIEHLDSLIIVDMLLEAEMQLEKATGRYLTLADETIFDASKSPLRTWRGWVAYVESKHAS
jgi:hypothetical protein